MESGVDSGHPFWAESTPESNTPLGSLAFLEGGKGSAADTVIKSDTLSWDSSVECKCACVNKWLSVAGGLSGRRVSHACIFQTHNESWG